MRSVAGITLRDLRPEDWCQVRVWETDEEILEYLGKKGLTTAWSESTDNEPTRVVLGARRRAFAIETHAGAFIGYVELREINWRRRAAELRVCIGEKDYWGKGYGTAAVRGIVVRSFEGFNLEYIYLRVYRENRRALRCYEKCGFRVEGILRAGGRTEDEIVLMGISRSRVGLLSTVAR